tara:strand:+ start:697 stop:1161 length:465 start_codon:yes stop_codon:yes gene_type:complete
MKTIDLILGSDHRGLELKHELLDWISPDDIENETKFDVAVIQNLKPHDNKKPVDYPDVLKEFGHYFDIYNHGILICGSGFGMCIGANRFKNVRAVVCRDVFDVEQARQHNNMNVLCMGADYTDFDTAKYMVEAFFTEKFEGGRHLRRVKKLGKL